MLKKLRARIDEHWRRHPPRVQVIGYFGTSTTSDRSPLDTPLDRKYFERSRVVLTDSGDAQPAEPLYNRTKYPLVQHLVTEAGHLRASDKRRPGCFGVTWWRAMDLKCAECPNRPACDEVVDYRLTFGGREDFKRALGNKSFAEKTWDTGAVYGSQGYEREVEDCDVHLLRSVHFRIWHESDAANRVQAIKGRRLAARDVRAERWEQLGDEMDDACFTLLDRVLDRGAISIVEEAFVGFLGPKRSEHRWRKRCRSPNALAVVEVSRQVVERVRRDNDLTNEEYGYKNQVHGLVGVLDLLLCDLRVDVAPEGYQSNRLDYNSVNRHLETLELIRKEASWWPDITVPQP